MVGRRHDRALCACSGEELREGREGGERERQRDGGERESEREGGRERESFRNSPGAAASSVSRAHLQRCVRAASPQHQTKAMTAATAHAHAAVYSGTHSHSGLCGNV